MEFWRLCLIAFKFQVWLLRILLPFRFSVLHMQSAWSFLEAVRIFSLSPVSRSFMMMGFSVSLFLFIVLVLHEFLFSGNSGSSIPGRFLHFGLWWFSLLCFLFSLSQINLRLFDLMFYFSYLLFLISDLCLFCPTFW